MNVEYYGFPASRQPFSPGISENTFSGGRGNRRAPAACRAVGTHGVATQRLPFGIRADGSPRGPSPTRRDWLCPIPMSAKQNSSNRKSDLSRPSCRRRTSNYGRSFKFTAAAKFEEKHPKTCGQTFRPSSSTHTHVLSNLRQHCHQMLFWG